jgi:hypothetical protein
LETSTKAIDLYAEETKRRDELLEKSVKENEEAMTSAKRGRTSANGIRSDIIYL